MARKIGQYAVHLHDKDGKLHSFLPGQQVPAWAEKRLGEHCFEDGDGVDDDKTVGAAIPPQSGRGAARDKWAVYAEGHGVDVEGLTQREIIAACQEAGVAVE